MNNNIELNEEFLKALHLLEKTSRNMFITGKAGTGKSTLLDYFRNTTKRKVVVLAPTGVAAVNVRGETIHSFFRFRSNVNLEKIKKIKSKKARAIYYKTDIIIIDEVSMVRADLLDCVDKFLRLNGKTSHLPFGGTQMVFIGDLYQLPPVVLGKEKNIFNSYYKSSYFFSAKVFDVFRMEFVELQKIYRQKDENFVNILNSIRNNTITEEYLKILNCRVKPSFKTEKLNGAVYLTSTNRLATTINHTQLNELKSELFIYRGEIEGEFDKKYLPTDYELQVKEGAQVILLNNDAFGRWVNGTIAKIVGIKKETQGLADTILVKLPGGNIEKVNPYKWELFHFEFNSKIQILENKVVGKFVQYPLKLAWAITIHKSQGKTFDKVIIDVSGGIFAYGQTYVALSRCTSLEGITLTHPIKEKHIFTDYRIVNFMTDYQYKISENILPLKEKIKIINQAIRQDNYLKITYLKRNDEKSQRTVKPIVVNEMIYLKRPFLGMEAYCFERKNKRVFRVDRILEISEG